MRDWLRALSSVRRRHLSANKSRPYHKVHHRLFFGCFQVFFFLRCPGLAQDPFLVSVTRPTISSCQRLSRRCVSSQCQGRRMEAGRKLPSWELKPCVIILGARTVARAEEVGRRKDRWDKKGDAIHSDPSHFPEFLVVRLLTKSIRVRQKL